MAKRIGEEGKDRLKALVSAGELTYAEIATELSCSVQTVVNNCRAMGIKKKDLRKKSDPRRLEMAMALMVSGEFSVVEICEALSIARDQVYRHLKRIVPASLTDSLYQLPNSIERSE